MMRPEVCDICGSTEVQTIKCKVICRNCGTILKSCADLFFRTAGKGLTAMLIAD